MFDSFKFIDLFAGVGGFHFALKDKAKCVFAAEWDSKARQTYLANHGKDLEANNATFASDITEVDYATIPDLDILCAGFPCQPFSLAGKREGFKHDTQGTLFFNIIEIIEAKRPSAIFLENVKNLRSHDKGNTFKVVIKALEEQGYLVHHNVLNALTHGNLPQNRERIFIVAFNSEAAFSRFQFPDAIPLTSTIKDCLQLEGVDDYFYQTNMDSESVKRMHRDIVKPWTMYQYRRHYVRENMKNVCPTLTANMGTGGHNVPLLMDDKGIRKLTPRECFNFQGFPEDLIIPDIANGHQYKQAGNSVPLPVVSRIADNIIKALKQE